MNKNIYRQQKETIMSEAGVPVYENGSSSFEVAVSKRIHQYSASKEIYFVTDLNFITYQMHWI